MLSSNAVKSAACRVPAPIGAALPRRATQPRQVWLQAEPSNGSDQPSTSGAPPAGADRIEALEAAITGKRAAARKIPIRGVTPMEERRGGSNMAEWKEGKLFPEGWESMPLDKKMNELYLGQRGILYWATQAAWFSCIGLAGSWVFFRFVGPALGLYTLKGDLLPPTL